MAVRPAVLALALTLLASPGAAQDVVGHPPDRSPFRDLEYRQEITLLGGHFRAGADPAGVAPRSGSMFGIRYEANVGGPVGLYARIGTVRSERMVIDPREPEATRELGIRSWPLYLLDVGVALNLTGQRSWHRLVPVVNGGFGVATDANRSVEEDPYRFGTPFAFVYGVGVRYVPGGRFQLRLGAENFVYRLTYPAAYYTEPGTGIPAVVPASQSRNFWKTNTALTVGGSLLFFR